MIEIIIGLILLFIVLWITYTYLTHNLVLILIVAAVVIIIYTLIKIVLEKKPRKKYTHKARNKAYRFDESECVIYKDLDTTNYQYEIDIMLRNETKQHHISAYNSMTDSQIAKERYTVSNPLYKYQQNTIIMDPVLQIQSDDTQKRIVGIYLINNDECTLFTLTGKEANEIIFNYDKIEYAAIRINGGESKYPNYNTMNGNLVVERVTKPYTLELLICYN